MKLRISPGNRKMGPIPSVSLPAVASCGKGIPCAKDCYVIRNMYRGRYGAAILASHRYNMELLRADRSEFFRQLSAFLTRTKPELFRYHVSGDWIDSDHLTRALDTARAHESTKFLSFTKRHDLLPQLSSLPHNFNIMVSQWVGWGCRLAGYRQSWYQDGTENRVPRGAIVCQGDCSSCRTCWNRRGPDVVFFRH